LHVGHTRGAIFGDALSSLLEYAGYNVTREYYINDGGGQVNVLARSVYLRYLEAHGQEVTFEDGTYPGDYLIAAGEALKDKVGAAYVDQPETVWLEDVRNFATDAMMDLIRADLASLGIKMDVSDLLGHVEAAKRQAARRLEAARAMAVQVHRIWR